MTLYIRAWHAKLHSNVMLHILVGYISLNNDLFNQDKFNLIYSIKIDLFFHQIRYHAIWFWFGFDTMHFLSKNVAIIVCQNYESFYFIHLLKDCKVSC